MHESLVIHHHEVVAVPLVIGFVTALQEGWARIVEPAVMRLVVVPIPNKHASFHGKNQLRLRLVYNRTHNNLRPVPRPSVLRTKGEHITEPLQGDCAGKGMKGVKNQN